jgi:transposase
MSLPQNPLPEVPVETAHVARAAFRKGNFCLQLRDELGDLFDDAAFAQMYGQTGPAAYAPWRLALVSILQFVETISDRAAADQVRGRIDWKYLLALPLEDPGFDASVLSDFRRRLLESEQGMLLFDRVLERCREKNLLKVRGKQRTDATHIVAAVRRLNHLELALTTIRHTLETLAQVVPEWVRNVCPVAWAERYGAPQNEWHLPEKEAARTELALQACRDGSALLDAVWREEGVYQWLQQVPAVEALRQIWLQQFVWQEGVCCWRTEKEGLVPGAQRICSPHDLEARYSEKRQTRWVGYKVHLTDTCDADKPRLITQVTTTPATTADVVALPQIQADLAERECLPEQQLVDSGYVEASALVESRKSYGIHLCGPPLRDNSWQAQAGEGFAATDFRVDWEAREAICPQGEKSVTWMDTKTKGQEVTRVKFSREACGACPVREQCTRTKEKRRSLTLPQRENFEALAAARAEMRTEAYQKDYALRSGSEGTMSQAVRRGGAHKSRYVGEEKTHLQNLLIATAINLVRALNWLSGAKVAGTRSSRLRQLLIPEPAMV